MTYVDKLDAYFDIVPKKNQKMKLDIIFEDNDLVVVNKPAGMLVIP